MKKILFPTDFSPAAEAAFIYALHVADLFGADITTLHVYKLPDIRGVQLPKSLQEVYESLDLEEFENYRDIVPRLHRIARENGLQHVPVRHAMQEGETVSCILRYAEELDTDLIIMGTKGATGLRELFFGSVAAEVMENANCPVLAVPMDAIFSEELKRFAMTTSFSEEEKKALDWLREFARPFKADIYVVNVDTAHVEEYRMQMLALRKAYPGIAGLHFTQMEGDFIEESLSRFLEANRIDMLVMLTHKRNFLQELFNYSHTKKMAYHSKIPILTIQAHTLEQL
jgi:nucleotide-binding universal stress UspA family protein